MTAMNVLERVPTGSVWTLMSAVTRGDKDNDNDDDYDSLPRFSADTLAYCGANTVCTNSLGSFSCPCAGGYEGFVANQGCSDVNECTHSSWNYYVGSVQSHPTQN